MRDSRKQRQRKCDISGSDKDGERGHGKMQMFQMNTKLLMSGQERNLAV